MKTTLKFLSLCLLCLSFIFDVPTLVYATTENESERNREVDTRNSKIEEIIFKQNQLIGRLNNDIFSWDDEKKSIKEKADKLEIELKRLICFGEMFWR